MTEIYLELEEITPYLDDAKREMFASRLPLTRAARIRSPRHPLDRARRAAAENALRHACRRAGENYADLRIAYTERGKPIIACRDDLSVSFSHCGNFGCAVLVRASGGIAPAVGVDIESEPDDPVRVRELAERFFGEEERAAVRAEENPAALFSRLWCLAEANAKMTGEGIALTHRAMPPERHFRVGSVRDASGTPYALALVLDAQVPDAFCI